MEMFFFNSFSIQIFQLIYCTIPLIHIFLFWTFLNFLECLAKWNVNLHSIFFKNVKLLSITFIYKKVRVCFRTFSEMERSFKRSFIRSFKFKNIHVNERSWINWIKLSANERFWPCTFGKIRRRTATFKKRRCERAV